MIPKLFTCMKKYSKQQFAKDVFAGIIVAIIALPLSIALGIASGVTPEKGLITAVIGGFIVSLFGGSRVQIGGPTGAFVIIVLGIVNKYGIVGLSIATIMAGIILIIMGFFKLGSLIKYIPYPITTGFTSGIAVVIASTQIKDFFGLPIAKVPGDFIEKIKVYTINMNLINYKALFIGALTILIIYIVPKINKKIPAALIAIIITTIIANLSGLNIATIQSQFGEIKNNISFISFAGINFNTIAELLPAAISIAVLGSIESLLSAVVSDGMIGGNHRSNIELVSQGCANIFSALFGGIPVTGAIARSAANVKNGGRTPIAGIVHSITLLFMMFIFMPFVKYIPMASLAGILLSVAYNMGEWKVFKDIKKFPKSDAFVLLTTFILTIIFDLIIAIEAGMILSLLLFMKRMSDITNCQYISPDNNEIHDNLSIDTKWSKSNLLAFYEINGPFFFGAADKFIQVIKSVQNMPKFLVLKLKHVPVIDATGYVALNRLYEMCKNSKTQLVLMEVQDATYRILDNYGFIDAIGNNHVCKNKNEVLELCETYIEKQTL